MRPRNSSSPKPTNRAPSYRLSSQLSAEPLKQPSAQGGQLELHDQICQMLHKVPRQSMNHLQHLHWQFLCAALKCCSVPISWPGTTGNVLWDEQTIAQHVINWAERNGERLFMLSTISDWPLRARPTKTWRFWNVPAVPIHQHTAALRVSAQGNLKRQTVSCSLMWEHDKFIVNTCTEVFSWVQFGPKSTLSLETLYISVHLTKRKRWK